ncbi:MAG: SMC-Scp complex subunit ScpB [Bifidobacterium thermacidophilum]|nr:SMC-Scp complex subunit ScpB [Bifidobacterium thermacidophilum]
MASPDGTAAPGGLDKLQQAWQADDFPGGLPACLEAVLMVADGPQQERDLARALHCDPKDVRDALESLQREYDGDLEHGIVPRGFALRSSARGWQYVSRSEFEPVVGAFVTDGQTSRLSQAALEALAIIAYKQPMTRAQVASIRGVNSDGVIRSLTVRGLVQEHGADPQTHAALLETTGLFLEYMGLDSLDDLPSLAPFLPADAGQVVREAAGEQLGAL